MFNTHKWKNNKEGILFFCLPGNWKIQEIHDIYIEKEEISKAAKHLKFKAKAGIIKFLDKAMTRNVPTSNMAIS